MQKDISHKWFFQQSPNEVWDYLTKPELIAEWLMDNDFKPIVGHKFQFKNNIKKDCENEGIAHCQVLEIIPMKRLSYSWKGGKGNDEITIDSVVVWTLSAKNGGTELRLQHKGFTLLEDFISHTNGWNTIMKRFTQLLNMSNNGNTNI
ncbi:MAG TPA: SRPBCC domain-containing protein [Chitinophagaceae bacterium]|nr:SRPBCC domain-containing protein [Chitinophagaceae bacterium]